jgi:cytochrome b561
MSDGKARIQLAWGVALVLAGIGVLYRIPQVMPKITRIEQFAAAAGFIYFCFYLMALILIVGGGRKIITYTKMLNRDKPDK